MSLVVSSPGQCPSLIEAFFAMLHDHGRQMCHQLGSGIYGLQTKPYVLRHLGLFTLIDRKGSGQTEMDVDHDHLGPLAEEIKPERELRAGLGTAMDWDSNSRLF